MSGYVFGDPAGNADTTPDVEAYAMAVGYRMLLLATSITDRDVQVNIGPSEVGGDCDRQVTYRLAGTPRVNLKDPLRTVLGTAMHLKLAEEFMRIDRGSGRYLVETGVSYRGLSGHADLYDRAEQTVVDWKTSTLDKLKRIRHDGPPRRHIVQLHIYGAGLRAAGESIETVALVYLPIDGELRDLHVWRAPLDQNIADYAVERLESLRSHDPATTTATPNHLCGWCPWYRAGSLDLAVACPGSD